MIAGLEEITDGEIAIDDIVPTLEAVATTGYDERIYVRADGAANYAMVMRVLGRINGAGYRNVGLVTLPEDS